MRDRSITPLPDLAPVKILSFLASSGLMRVALLSAAMPTTLVVMIHACVTSVWDTEMPRKRR